MVEPSNDAAAVMVGDSKEGMSGSHERMQLSRDTRTPDVSSDDDDVEGRCTRVLTSLDGPLGFPRIGQALSPVSLSF
jgi:hypothetical protein